MFGFQSPEELILFAHRHMMAERARESREVPELNYGDYWVSVIDFVPEVVVIFGHVEPLESLAEKARNEGADRMEVTIEQAAIKRLHDQGFMYGKHYSELCPEGEYGSTKASDILAAITEEDFEAARAAGWQLMPLMLEGREFASRVMGLAGLEDA